MSLEGIAAFVLILALSLYVVTGCADFGAGFWELVLRGKGREKEESLITAAIAPIWEANHVWLVVIVVLIAGAFPRALAVISTALHVPLLLMLMGITLRGAAFVFRHYGPPGDRFQRTWGYVFSVSSAIAPFFLGVALGGAVGGSIRVDSNGVVKTDFISDWLSPFPLSVGAYTLAIGVFLSAVYLTAVAMDPDVGDAFRRHAIRASVALGGIAWAVLVVSRYYAPLVFERLTAHEWSWPFHVVTAILSIGALVFLIRGAVELARAAAILQAFAIMVGLGLDQYPYIVAPDVTIFNSVAPNSSLQTLLEVTFLGLLIVIPGFAYLYWVFRSPAIEHRG